MRYSSVNFIKKKSLTSGKRVKVRKKLIYNELCLDERLSPPRMAGKKASSKSLCGFVFLLHVLENQILESASPRSDVSTMVLRQCTEKVIRDLIGRFGVCYRNRDNTSSF